MNTTDIEQLKDKGISIEQVKKQLNQFKTGFPYADIQRPATYNDGIEKVDDKKIEELVNSFEKELTNGLNVVKFIPASGAATRMFKNMFEFKNASPEEQSKMANEKPYNVFLSRIDNFAFGKIIKDLMPKCPADYINLMLDESGLGYGQKPKGVLLFHNYPDGARTAAEEHLYEGYAYANANGKIRLHYTVSPSHIELFKAATKAFKQKIEKEKNVEIEITYSFQKPSTDTIAATMDNEPFRNDEGKLVFRPAGHGALIENLNDLNADLVFIKNIDNVAQDHLLPTTAKYKKVLAGFAMEKKRQVDALLADLETAKPEAIEKAVIFINDNLKVIYPNDFDSMEAHKKTLFIKEVLNRPLRVCGMVKNEGEPGGGPFWVKGTDGQTTLQVVESAQIDTENAEKAEIMKQSTHFNPVDLVCCVRNYKGDKFDLTKFVDHNAGFISHKSLNGKELKAMELPGLWNGAMANWLTFFVEVPIETFNPVKTVMDLLRPQHQPK